MITVNVEQGTPEWMAARSGIPTSSCFSKIVTPKGALSKSSVKYRNQLLAEWMMGCSLEDSFTSDWMDRGIEMEEDAYRYYELQRDAEVERVGFCMRDDALVGCSPDGLVGDDGGIEIKCPSPGVHVGYLFNMAEEYRTQVQGSLWVTGRDWWDLMSYHPEMPPAIVRVEPDKAFIETLAGAVNAFIDGMMEAREELVRRGITDRPVRKEIAA